MQASHDILNWSQLCDERLGDAELPELPSRLAIPRPPKSVSMFLDIARSSTSDLKQLTEIIERDTELTSQVLRLINSSAYGLSRKVSSIQRASTLLGHRRCKVLLMSAALTASMQSASHSDQGSGDFLSRSLERAVFARCTADALGTDQDAAYVAALLQDLMLPFLKRVYAKEYQRFSASSESLSHQEQVQFGWDHATMAAKILKSWSFPDEVVCGVAFHHDLDAILGNEQYRRSSLIAPAISALLPDLFRQEPNGLRTLFQVQELLPEFRFIEIAADVDEEFGLDDPQSGHRDSLCDQLSRLAMNVIEQNRKPTTWLGRTIGQYTLEEKIGEGSMGEVYRARHSMLRRPAAVKLMAIAHLNSDTLSRFEQEAQATSQLSSPHTVQVYDYGTTPEGVLFYVMEYLDGMSLRELVYRYGPQTEGRVIHILSQICGSLAEAHGKGLIHRDVKPDNIVLSMSGGVSDFAKLLDFGLVEVVDGSTADAQSPTVQGTPLYMAPEAILRPEAIDARTDVYALGAVGYYLLTGFPLFTETKVADVLQLQVTQLPPSPSERLDRNVSDDLESLLMQCLSKSADERPQCVLELADRLSQCQAANDWSFDDARNWWTHHVTNRDCASSMIESLSWQLNDSQFDDEVTSTTQINLAEVEITPSPV